MDDLAVEDSNYAFAEEVRAFLRAKLPPDLRDAVRHHRQIEREGHVRWHKVLSAQGWATPQWPVEHGGTGWSPLRAYRFHYECAFAGAPDQIPFGVKMVAPVIIKYGSEKQKRSYLPRIRDADDWWCQGYSEPASGSDLASLQLKAKLVDDTFVLNGQKTWTTYAQHADMMFCLVRTASGESKQRGISFLLIDMKTPGITIRPIITMDGAHEVNEVFFDDVRVPAENLVGEINQGWTYAKFLLEHERFPLTGPGKLARELTVIREVLQAKFQRTSSARELAFRRRLAELHVRLKLLDLSLSRALGTSENGAGVGAKASMFKIRYSNLTQDISALTIDIVGIDGLQADGSGRDSPSSGMAAHYLNMRKMTIFGGSNEIQRNILAKTFFGL
jgi:alkylation response protein AidB-like acyl-CoA dehydrogenase